MDERLITKYKLFLEKCIYENCGNYYIGVHAIEKVIKMHEKELNKIEMSKVKNETTK